MITLCVLVLHLGFATCYDPTAAQLKKQRDLCQASTTCAEVRDKHDPRRLFIVHARMP